MPASMFCAGSVGSVTPYIAAVAGMSCIAPLAPLVETAVELPFDSTSMIAWTSTGSTPYLLDSFSINAVRDSLPRLLESAEAFRFDDTDEPDGESSRK